MKGRKQRVDNAGGGLAFCRVCHRALRKPESIKAGIGPVCGGKEPKGEERGMKMHPELFCDRPLGPWTGNVNCQRIDGIPYTNVPHTKMYHSPTGYEWGYCGAGPADFALNILHQFTDPRTADRLHQEFKEAFIAVLPPEGGRIDGEDIRAWLRVRA